MAIDIDKIIVPGWYQNLLPDILASAKPLLHLEILWLQWSCFFDLLSNLQILFWSEQQKIANAFIEEGLLRVETEISGRRFDCLEQFHNNLHTSLQCAYHDWMNTDRRPIKLHCVMWFWRFFSITLGQI